VIKNALPQSWIRCTLADVGNVVSGGTPSTQNSDFWGDEINWISPSDLTGNKSKFISRGAKSLSKLGLKNCSAKLMPSGSVHFSSRAPIGYVVISSESLCTNQGFKSLVPSGGVFSDYVYFYLKSIKALANSLATGTTFKELSGTAFAKLPFPLPPLAEQKRIVAKIEELFSELEAGEESLRLARRQLATYRQSLLKQAFEGKLTQTWRTQNPAKIKSPETLIARIQSTRQSRHEQLLEEWATAVKEWESAETEEKRPPKPQKLIPIRENIAVFDTPIPESWASLNLSQFVLELGQGWSPKCENREAQDDEWSVIKTTAIQFGNFDPSANKALPKHLPPRRWLGLHCGEILITRAGPRSRCGVVCRVRGDHPRLMICDKAYRLVLFEGATSPEFVERLLCSPAATAAIEKLKTGINDSGVNITQSAFLQLALPIPPPPEQHEIVRLLDEQFEVIERNEREIDAALRRSEALRQSILHRAFTGKLVPQDPANEPATELLARLQEERAGSARIVRKKTRP
jgi:type I restriction enzyme S subunit